MKLKYSTFMALVIFSVLLVSSGLHAVDTRQIDQVRSKGVLDSGDFQIIDNFVADAVQELVSTEDFTSIAKTRTAVLLRSRSETNSAATQYSEQFVESAHNHISDAFKEAQKLATDKQKSEVIVNLLILVDDLGGLRLVDLARKWLDNDNKVIRYWAVHCVTNPDITKQLNSGEAANSKLASEITKQLEVVLDSSSADTISLMAEFAATVQIPEGEELLLRIADMRIHEYFDWTVDYELLDGNILSFLYDKISSAGLSSRAALGGRFGQLYSYVFQRYVKGRDFLSETHKEYLASVLVETEKTLISNILGRPQSVVRKTVEQDDYVALLAEDSRLFGDKTRAGQIPLRLNFDYGKNPDGSKRIAPLELPNPAEIETSK
jgi:hypothetical protein